MKKSEKTRQGLYNVGFIGMRIAKAGSPPTNHAIKNGERSTTSLPFYNPSAN
jgi:hypothetical protein